MKTSISQLADKMVKKGKSREEIEAALLGRGVAPCVAREWAGEPRRRALFLKFGLRRTERWDASKFGARGTPHRRIIHTRILKGKTLEFPLLDPVTGATTVEKVVIPDREFVLHATKGWRNYRVMA